MNKKKLKIGYFADGPWSHQAFIKIINDDTFDIKFIVPRNDTKDNTLLNFSKKHNILLSMDEVQTGFGRTGMNFAHQLLGLSLILWDVVKQLVVVFYLYHL